MADTNKIALQQELDQARKTLTKQEQALSVTLAVIEEIKSPDGTAPKRIVDKRDRQYNTVNNTKAYIVRLETALGTKRK